MVSADYTKTGLKVKGWSKWQQIVVCVNERLPSGNGFMPQWEGRMGLCMHPGFLLDSSPWPMVMQAHLFGLHNMDQFKQNLCEFCLTFQACEMPHTI